MITGFYAGILAIIFSWLSLNVAKTRRIYKVALGDDDNFEIQRRIRAQGNFAEYTPIFLILLGLAENIGVYKLAIHFFGLLFVLGRIIHAYSLLKAEIYQDKKITAFPRIRFTGMMMTLFSLISLSIILIVNYLFY